MDESEKRKERLRAMRVEAEEAEASHNVTNSAVPGYLSNPLAEDVSAIRGHEEPCTPSRFDFYTDPMAAFSSDTKRVKVGNHIAPNHFKHSNTGGSPMARFSSPLSGGPRPRNPEMTARPPHQFQSNYSPDQRMHQVQGFSKNSGSFLMQHRNPPGSPGFGPQGSPGFRPPGSHGFGPPGSPGFGPPGSPGFGPPGSPGFRPPASLGFRPPASPDFRPAGSPGFNTGQGMEHWLSHNPSPRSVHGGSPSPSSSSGRGGGRWSTSPGSGWRGGRGLSSHGRPSMDRQQLGPERFYNDSMVEDPWKSLKPVIWKGVDTLVNRLNTPGSTKPSMEKSGSTKHASISEVLNKSSQKPSLAEYLATSFNEAADDIPTT